MKAIDLKTCHRWINKSRAHNQGNYRQRPQLHYRPTYSYIITGSQWWSTDGHHCHLV